MVTRSSWCYDDHTDSATLSLTFWFMCFILHFQILTGTENILTVVKTLGFQSTIMAASANPSELKYLLECSIYLNRFQDPRVLPCLHSYCLECLHSHISSNKSSDGTFCCPECREMCIPPEGGVDNFPKNFFVNAMKDVIPAPTKAYGENFTISVICVILISAICAPKVMDYLVLQKIIRWSQ